MAVSTSVASVVNAILPSGFAIPLSHSPGAVLQIRMRLHSLITAHFAAHSYSHTVLSPGLGNIATSGTVAQETSHCHDKSSAALQLIYLDLFCLDYIADFLIYLL